MIRPVILSLLLALAGPALGCESFATSPTGSFREISARVGRFVMAYGSFEDGPLRDEIFAITSEGRETSIRHVAGRFFGHSASMEGFTEPLETELAVLQRCDDSGCHPRLDGTPYLVFLEHRGARYIFAEDGCALRAYANPAPEVLNAVIACVNGTCP